MASVLVMESAGRNVLLTAARTGVPGTRCCATAVDRNHDLAVDHCFSTTVESKTGSADAKVDVERLAALETAAASAHEPAVCHVPSCPIVRRVP